MDKIYLAQSIPNTDWQIKIEGDEHSFGKLILTGTK